MQQRPEFLSMEEIKIYQCVKDNTTGIAQTHSLLINTLLAFKHLLPTAGHVYTAPSKNKIEGEKIRKFIMSHFPKLKNKGIFVRDLERCPIEN